MASFPTPPAATAAARPLERRGVLILLGTLYLSQGLPYGFFTQTVPVLLRQSGKSNTLVGLSLLLMLPWGLKWLWAPYVDSRRGPGWRAANGQIWPLGLRRSWILPLQWATAAVMLGLGLVDVSTGLPWLLAALLVVNFLSATQDIATDGLAIELLPPGDRGLANGLQVGAYRLGMILGGGLLLMFIDRLGWHLAFGLMAAALVLATVPILRHREAETASVSSPSAPSIHPMRAAAEWFALPGARRLALALVLYKAFDAMASAMTRSLLVDRGYDLGDVGAANGTVGSITALLGAMLGGWIVQRAGTGKALGVLGVLQTLAVAGWIVPALGHASDGVLYAVIGLDQFWGSAATAALFAHMMNHSRSTHAGADYTVQASVVVLATGVASGLSGVLCDALGYPLFFTTVTALTLVGLVTALRLLKAAPTLATTR